MPTKQAKKATGEPSKCSVKCVMLYLFRFWLKTISGFVFLAASLWSIQWVEPTWYEALTFWANQKIAPTILGCTFDPLPSVPEEKELKRYQVTIHTSINDSWGMAFIVPRIQHVSMLDAGQA